jgi:hypothetical protein
MTENKEMNGKIILKMDFQSEESIFKICVCA